MPQEFRKKCEKPPEADRAMNAPETIDLEPNFIGGFIVSARIAKKPTKNSVLTNQGSPIIPEKHVVTKVSITSNPQRNRPCRNDEPA